MTRRGYRLRAAGRITLGVAALGLLLGVAGTPATAADPARLAVASVPQVTKYYVVAPPENGRKEFLFDIAERVLGAGDRWVEIYQLNQGRLQPGGGALTDPQLIQPGWVLRLPPDAAGAGVRTGPLPPVTARPPSQAGTSGAGGTPGSAPPAAALGAGPAPAGMASVVGICLGLVVGLPLLSAAHWRRQRRRREPRAVPEIPLAGFPPVMAPVGVQFRTGR